MLGLNAVFGGAVRGCLDRFGLYYRPEAILLSPPEECLLLDDKDHLKLTDFGSAGKYGSHLEVGTPPYVRWHSVEVGDEDNSLGIMGPTSEQFAIGSTIYYMIEGYELYGNECFGKEHLVEVVEL
jgi:serine/threonine protein kinase